MASNLIKITSNYVDTTNGLLNGTYTVGENLYITKATLKVTNKSADAVVIGEDVGGIIGVLEHAPSVGTTGSPMALRLKNLDATMLARVKTLLAATEML